MPSRRRLYLAARPTPLEVHTSSDLSHIPRASVTDLSTSSEVLTFRSKAHPHSMPRAVVYGRALVRPIAACMLPVMILTLVGVLEGVQILPGLLWASGAALLIASAWTSFRLQRQVAVIRISSEFASAQTVSDVLNDVPPRWQQVLDVRDYGTWAHVTIGLTPFELDRAEWDQYYELISALKSCSRAAHPGG